MENENLRGYNDLIILSILFLQDSYGYEISKEITEKSCRKYIIKEATLYSALNRLEKLGYISSYKGKESNGSPRTYYKLTPTGKQYFFYKRNEWLESSAIIKRFLGCVRSE